MTLPGIGLADHEDEPVGPWRSALAIAILLLVRLCGPRLRAIACMLVALVAVLALSAATATGARRETPTCAWGASSVSAEVVDGHLVTSQPSTSGCTPQRALPHAHTVDPAGEIKNGNVNFKLTTNRLPNRRPRRLDVRTTTGPATHFGHVITLPDWPNPRRSSTA